MGGDTYSRLSVCSLLDAVFEASSNWVSSESGLSQLIDTAPTRALKMSAVIKHS